MAEEKSGFSLFSAQPRDKQMNNLSESNCLPHTVPTENKRHKMIHTWTYKSTDTNW